MSCFISLIWLFTPSLCSFAWLPFCVLNTKKNALPIMSLAACASETNDFSCFKEVFSLFSNKLQNGWKLSVTPTSPERMTSRWPETLGDPVKIRDWNKLGYQLTVSLEVLEKSCDLCLWTYRNLLRWVKLQINWIAIFIEFLFEVLTKREVEYLFPYSL